MSRARPTGGFHPHGLAVVVFLAEGDVVASHEPVLEALVAHVDALQPFRVRDPVPARRYQPQREAVVGRQGSPVHLVAKDVLWIHGIGERHAAREILLELDVVGSRDLAFVGAPEDDLDAAVEDPGLLQDRGERRARPARIADAAVEKREAGVARAFDRKRDFLARPSLDVGERQGHRLFDQAADFELPSAFVDDRPIEMRD